MGRKLASAPATAVRVFPEESLAFAKDAMSVTSAGNGGNCDY